MNTDTPITVEIELHVDTCHQDGCTAEIDRGLAYLCGDMPGYAGNEGGCGWWYCQDHLSMPPEVKPLVGGGFCPVCMSEYEAEHPGCWEREESLLRARHPDLFDGVPPQ